MRPSGLRWAIVWVRLDPTEGHEQAGRRPAVVVSFEPFHRASLLTVLPITSARTEARYPGDVPLPAGTGGLADAGVIICQPRTISARRVLGSQPGRPGVIGHVEDPGLRTSVRDAIAHHFGLDLRPIRDGALGVGCYTN